MVGAGSSANFTCRSNIQDGIDWWYYASLGKPTSYRISHNLPSAVLPAVVSCSSDGRTSIVQLHHVEKQHSGTFKCMDSDAAAFAHLTVLGK